MSGLSSRLSDRGSGLDSENPWPGLASYGEADAPFFHGRATAAEALLSLVESERVTVLFGSSGLGKTSLLCAGLFPLLRAKGGWPVRIRLGFGAGQPDLADQVRQSIAAEAEATGVETPPWNESDGLWEMFHRRDGDFWSPKNRPLLPVLVFDQFEELFTLGGRLDLTGGPASRFIEELAGLTEGRTPESVRQRLAEAPEAARAWRFDRHPYRIVISLREDFLPELESLKSRLPSTTFNRTRLLPMTGADALRVVTQAKGLVSDVVAERIVRFVAAAEGRQASTPLADLNVEPTLLSVMCRELNKLRQERRQEQITGDLLTGHREQVLSSFYERAVAGFPANVRSFIEDQLLTVSGRRDSVALENVLESEGIPGETIDTLVAQRLLRIEERGGVRRAELSHDVLTGVIRESRDRRRLRDSVEKARVAETVPLRESKGATEPAQTGGDLDDGWALCLSGGGFRAVLFHSGALWRLNEVGFLPRLDRLAAVSAGSIVAAVLGSSWTNLRFSETTGVAENFVEVVVNPLRRLTGETLDVGVVFGGLLGFSGPKHRLDDLLGRRLFGGRTLQDLPDHPRIVIAATNLQSGALWNFSKPYMRDWRVGEVKHPELRLATAVAASTAVPPIPPVVLTIDEAAFAPGSGADLQFPPYTTRVYLVDGAIYDNLALETVWKRYRNIIVSDAGTSLQPDPEPKTNFLQSIARVFDLTASSTRSLRKRQLIAAYATRERRGAYWGIQTRIEDYGTKRTLSCPYDDTSALASIPSRLSRIAPMEQERLINWGYAVCDAALRGQVEVDFAPPDAFPYPDAGVG